MAILGTATRAISTGYSSILWIIRWPRFSLSAWILSHRLYQLEGPILLLFDIRLDVVPVLVVANLRETTKASDDFDRRAQIHWEIFGRIDSSGDANNSHHAVEQYRTLDASVCHYYCEFLPIVEFLHARQLPDAIPQANVRHQFEQGRLVWRPAAFNNGYDCSVGRYSGRSST